MSTSPAAAIVSSFGNTVDLYLVFRQDAFSFPYFFFPKTISLAGAEVTSSGGGEVLPPFLGATSVITLLSSSVFSFRILAFSSQDENVCLGIPRTVLWKESSRQLLPFSEIWPRPGG